MIKTSLLYNRAREKFSAFMYNLGVDEEVSLNKLDEIDIGYIENYGFMKERYPYSLGKTYEYFCKENGKKIDLASKKKVEDIGWYVFQQIPELVRGVHPVLKTLRRKYLLILATLGDPRVQKEKIKSTGLDKYFSDVNVLKHKNVEEYQDILSKNNLDKKETWIIGNSIRSDLNPGLKLGLHCILIPYLSWKFEDEEPISSNYLKLDTLTEVLKHL